jgi:integrase
MDLDALLRQVDRDADLERCTFEQYRRVIRKLSEFIGKTSTTDDLQLETVNAFLASLKDKGLTGTTIRNYRSAITRIWNTAIEQELAEPYNPRRLRTPKILRRPVKSWTPSQVKILIDASDLLTDRLNCGVCMGSMLAAWIRVGYDTGLRPSDLRLLRWTDVDLDAQTAIVTQHKTHIPHTARLSIQAVMLLLRIETPPRPLVFPLTKGGMRRLELLLYAVALSLGFRRVKGQGLGTLRKTHATQIYERDGEHAAAESLGHIGGTRTLRQCYVDHRSIKSGRLPPEPMAS